MPLIASDGGRLRTWGGRDVRRPVDDVRREYMRQVDGGGIDAAYQQGLEWSQGGSAGIQWRESGPSPDGEAKKDRGLRSRKRRGAAEGSRRGQGKGRRSAKAAEHRDPAPLLHKSFVRGGLRGRRKARAEREYRRCAMASLAEAAALIQGGVQKAAELQEIPCQPFSRNFPLGEDGYRGADAAKGRTTAAHDAVHFSRKRGTAVDGLPGKERWKRGRLPQMDTANDGCGTEVGMSTMRQANADPVDPTNPTPCTSNVVSDARVKASKGMTVQDQIERKEEEKLAREDGYSYGEWIARSSTSFLADKNSCIEGVVTLESFVANFAEKEKELLLSLLPKCDQEALLGKDNPFNKEVFKSHVAHYHSLLGKGLLERDANTHWVPPRGRTDDSRLRRERALQQLAGHMAPTSLLAVQEGKLTAPDALLGFDVEEDRKKAGRTRKNGASVKE